MIHFILILPFVQISANDRPQMVWEGKALTVKLLFLGKSNLVDGINIRLIHWLRNCATLHSACNCRISIIYTPPIYCKYCNNLWKNESNSGKVFVSKLFVETALFVCVFQTSVVSISNIIFLQKWTLTYNFMIAIFP